MLLALLDLRSSSFRINVRFSILLPSCPARAATTNILQVIIIIRRYRLIRPPFLLSGYKGKRLAWFETKLPNLAVVLDVPFHVFAANVQDGFRKPDIGMWTHYAAQCNDGVAIGELLRCFCISFSTSTTSDGGRSTAQIWRRATTLATLLVGKVITQTLTKVRSGTIDH